MKMNDTALRDAVLHELQWDTRVRETGVAVEVHDGVVTLRGSVPSWVERDAAQQAAHRIDGVLDVANDIEVRLPSGTDRSDTEIAQAVRQALEWSAVVPSSQIRSTISDGVVTLEGEVALASQREDAERVLIYLTGVRVILNRIVVKGPSAEPRELRASIESALKRRAHRDAKQIAVAVDGGRVTVTGAVRSLREKRAVLGAARGTRGVSRVDSDLRIEP